MHTGKQWCLMGVHNVLHRPTPNSWFAWTTLGKSFVLPSINMGICTNPWESKRIAPYFGGPPRRFSIPTEACENLKLGISLSYFLLKDCLRKGFPLASITVRCLGDVLEALRIVILHPWQMPINTLSLDVSWILGHTFVLLSGWKLSYTSHQSRVLITSSE